MKIYTLGYSGLTRADLQRVQRALGAVFVDVRYSARSRAPQWNKGALQALLGENYAHVPEFGNVNYKNGGPIQFADLEGGCQLVAQAFGERPIVLLCSCPLLSDCHRLPLSVALAERFGGEVVHLDKTDLHTFH